MLPRKLQILLSLVLIVGFAGIAGVGGYLGLFAITPTQPSGATSVVFEVHRGWGPTQLSEKLAATGVIHDSRRLYWLGRVTRSWGHVKAGEYELSAGMTPLDILGVIKSGISIPYPITITEGQNIYEVAETLAAKKLVTQARFLELCRNPEYIASLGFKDSMPSLEGYLFPETYYLSKTSTAEEIISQMVRKFNSTWGPAEETRAKELGMTRHQVVILASIVEKETGLPTDRAKISAVFHNRLKKRMRLQTDPTVIYGIWENYRGNISRADLQRPNPYNTYTVDALPAGPISNPGKEAIQATLYPASTQDLYFVSQNDGHTVFTRTLEDHNAAVRRFQIDPKAREGKSWRDLKKNQGP